MYNVEVNEEKCVGCGGCNDVCPVEVFELQDEKSVPVNAEECLGCERGADESKLGFEEIFFSQEIFSDIWYLMLKMIMLKKHLFRSVQI